MTCGVTKHQIACVGFYSGVERHLVNKRSIFKHLLHIASDKLFCYTFVKVFASMTIRHVANARASKFQYFAKIELVIRQFCLIIFVCAVLFDGVKGHNLIG